MPPRRDDGTDQPFVDSDSHGDVVSTLGRILERVAPDSYVAGGANEGASLPHTRPHNYDTLTEREQIYLGGGPITDFIDTRALMTYGTGVEFTTSEPAFIDDEGRTVAEWLHDAFPLIDQLMVERGIHTYVYGDAWPEVVTTRGGGIDRINLIHPTTVDPSWDAHGTITDLRQVVKDERGQFKTQPLSDDRVGHWYYKQASAGPLGESLIAQNRQEIDWYLQNQEQRANAIRLHGSPKYHVAVGSEGQSISDRLLRRVRDKFRSEGTDEKTNWVTGGDIEVSELDTPGFDGMNQITETDITKLASGFGVPIEWTNFGSAGLGEGTPAESRITKFERQARAEQRRAAEQVLEFPLRFIVDELSPFPAGIAFDVQFGDVVSDPSQVAEWLTDFTDFYTRDEIRGKFGDEELTDEQEQAIEDRLESEGGAPEAGGGLFTRREQGEPDAPDPLAGDDAAKRAHADGGRAGGSGNANSGRALLHGPADADALTQEELVWEDVYEEVLWADDTSRDLFQFDPEEVPDFVVARLREAVAQGALFDDFETVPPGAVSQIQSAMLDSLETRHGWSVDSIAENLQDQVPSLTKQEAERIGRTETQALVNEAREEGYREEFDLDEERFDWVGPSDDRTTETCEAIKDRIPDAGVTLSELQDIVAEEARAHGHDPREWTPHINCRHTFTRQV